MLANEKAEQLSLRILPAGTKLSAVRLSDLRTRIVEVLLPLLQLQDELEQLQKRRRNDDDWMTE